MSEERFIDMDTRLAHQDQLLIALNDVMTKQQEKIMRLEELCASIVERIRSLGDASPSDAQADEPPPHY